MIIRTNDLVKCFECGYENISGRAERCPKCETIFFQGVECGFCKKRLAISNSIVRNGLDNAIREGEMHSTFAPGDYVTAFHTECLKEFLSDVTAKCTDCGMNLGFEYFKNFIEHNLKLPCPKCASPQPLTFPDFPLPYEYNTYAYNRTQFGIYKCYCGIPIFKCIPHSYEDGFSHKNEKVSPVYYHDFCANNDRVLEEIKKAREAKSNLRNKVSFDQLKTILLIVIPLIIFVLAWLGFS